MKEKNTLGKTALFIILTLSILWVGGCEIESGYLDSIKQRIEADLGGGASYTVTYFGNNNTSGSVPVDSTTYFQGDTVEVLGNTGALERTNYTFDGWNTQEDGEGNRRDPGDTFLMGTANVELHAIWAINTPTVTFMPEDGSTPTPETKQVTYGETYGSLATTSRTGYSFDGWYDAASGGNEITAASTVTKNYDHNLYAYWTARTYDLFFDEEGGDAVLDTSVIYDSAYGSLPVPIREGYAFGGWWTGDNGTGSQVISSTTVTTAGNHTLHAKWDINSYSVTYNVNGATSGSVPAGPTDYDYQETVTVLANLGALEKIPIPAGTAEAYKFGGWDIVEDGSNTIYTAGMTFDMGTSDVTLIANWVEFEIGDTGPAGGVVYYRKTSFTNGWRYLEAPLIDQSTDAEWYGYGQTIGTSSVLGAGPANTSAIIDDLGNSYSYAAKICNDFSFGGYSDWFLPSFDELYQMYLQRAVIGGFSLDYYWSSSEENNPEPYSTIYAKDIRFQDGHENYLAKDDKQSVRAARRF